MNAIRTFVAISLPDPIHERLDEIIIRLKKAGVSGVRWVPAQNIHLTLKFLGDVSPANLDLLEKILQPEISRHHPFEITIGGLGAFPNLRRPRVIWVGVKTPPALENIRHAIEAETQRLGYAAEERPFSPHLTLGRISHNASPQEIQQIASVLSVQTAQQLGTIRVKNVQLFRSDLRPGGSVYTSLFSFPLSPP